MVFSELYMITDKSNKFQATEEFVDRRMEDFYELDSFCSYITSFVSSGFLVKNNILDVFKHAPINEETKRMQEEYFERLKDPKF